MPPLIYVIPGLGDDGAELSILLAILRGPRSVVVLPNVPDIDMPYATCIGMEATVTRLVDQIVGTSGTAPIVLIGYSIGGTLAVAAGARLAELGITVRDIILIDSSAVYPPAQQSLFAEARRCLRYGFGYVSMLLPLIMTVRRGHLKLARAWVLTTRPCAAPSARHDMRMILLIAYWVRAVTEYSLPRYSGSVLLAKASRGRPRITHKLLGWSGLIDRLDVETIEGNHWSILDNPNLYHVVRNRLSVLTCGGSQMPEIRSTE